MVSNLGEARAHHAREEKIQPADTSLVYHLSAGCLQRSGLQSWTGGVLASSFSRREVEWGDVRTVLRHVRELIDRSAIEKVYAR